MGLLVPFMFFFEKLVFGFTDIRRQLAAQGAIFVLVFLLLRLLHPAFHMIRFGGERDAATLALWKAHPIAPALVERSILLAIAINRS